MYTCTRRRGCDMCVVYAIDDGRRPTMKVFFVKVGDLAPDRDHVCGAMHPVAKQFSSRMIVKLMRMLGVHLWYSKKRRRGVAVDKRAKMVAMQQLDLLSLENVGELPRQLPPEATLLWQNMCGDAAHAAFVFEYTATSVGANLAFDSMCSKFGCELEGHSFESAELKTLDEM